MKVASTDGLDHRAGRRVAVEHFARVMVPGRGRWLGLMTNASLSGSYVRMQARPELHAPVIIQPIDSAELLRGVVARVDEGGIGIEWLAPQVRALAWLNRRTGLQQETGRGEVASAH